jgi:hypothetical protein
LNTHNDVFRAQGLFIRIYLLFPLCPTQAPAQETPPLPKLATAIAFPNSKFDRPVALVYPDDGSNLLFVNEQRQGKVFSFPNDWETSRPLPALTPGCYPRRHENSGKASDELPPGTLNSVWKQAGLKG